MKPLAREALSYPGSVLLAPMWRCLGRQAGVTLSKFQTALTNGLKAWGDSCEPQTLIILLRFNSVGAAGLYGETYLLLGCCVLSDTRMFKSLLL